MSFTGIDRVSFDAKSLETRDKNLSTILKEYVKGISTEKIKSLMNLEFKGKLLLTMDNPDFIYEVIGLLNESSYEDVYNTLSNINEDAVSTKVIFRSTLYDKDKEVYDSDISKLREKVKIQYGDACSKCGSTNTISYSKQTRSGDEAATYVTACNDCGKNTHS